MSGCPSSSRAAFSDPLSRISRAVIVFPRASPGSETSKRSTKNWDTSLATNYAGGDSFAWIESFTSAEIGDGAWIEVRFSGGTTSVEEQNAGSTLRIQRLR